MSTPSAWYNRHWFMIRLRNSFVRIQSTKRRCTKYTRWTERFTSMRWRSDAYNVVEYRVFIEQDGSVVSPFHDIPLFADEKNGILNMIVKAPRWTNAKMNISLELPLNPVRQETTRHKLRYIRNCFPHNGYIWNYGAFPQVSIRATLHLVSSTADCPYTDLGGSEGITQGDQHKRRQ